MVTPLNRIYVEITYWTFAINEKPFTSNIPKLVTQRLPFDLPADAQLHDIDITEETSDLIARINFPRGHKH